MRKSSRICIYPKDIMIITGKGERYGRKLIGKIKTAYSKNENQFVTIYDFCEFTGLDIEIVKSLIVD